MKTEGKIIGTSIITAIAASLCCITPVLSLIIGAGGLASTFSWLEPARPYLIGLTVVILCFAWYQKLRPQKQEDCLCETKSKTKFLQSSFFLGLITVFSALMLAFPSYSSIFYPKSENEVVTASKSDIKTVEFTINGMTCEACGEHINHEVNKLKGIIRSNASYQNKNAVVTFDDTKTSIHQIKEAINSTGYTVVNNKKK
ncbi:mercuric transport protein MerTP [Chryseobacterium sp. JK1]|uniref:mercuric transport protein MerTP n=1 Tax=Chryseobacterium sp. JK1 TaxID=874294 RepID=UPI003D691408